MKRHFRRLLAQEDLNFLLTNRVPRIALTHFMGKFSKIRNPIVSRASIGIWKLFTDLDLSDARTRRFRSMHDCFTRELKPGARDLASQVDIMPTLLALSGAEIPDGVQGQNLFGKAMEEFAFAEGDFPSDWRMLVRGYNKIVATPKGEITYLFNLAEDPYEMTNLAHDSAQKLKLASLKAQLLVQMQKLGDGRDPSGLRIR